MAYGAARVITRKREMTIAAQLSDSGDAVQPGLEVSCPHVHTR